MSSPAQQPHQATQYIERTVAQLPATIAHQKVMLDDYNATVGVKALQWLLARRQQQDVASDLSRKHGG